MSDLHTISAKKLGWLAHPEFCERCFFVRWHMNWKTPFAMGMPLYNIADRAQKRHITEHIAKFGRAPEWMADLGDIVGTIEPPSYRQFFLIDEENAIKVWGQADLILVRADGKLVIVDLKTSRARGDEDYFASTYLVQQTTYSLCAEFQGLGEVAGAALLYFSALTDEKISFAPAEGQAGNMVIPFATKVHWLSDAREQMPPLCEEVRRLIELTEIPAGREGCKDCALMNQMSGLITGDGPLLAVASSMAGQSETRRQRFARAIGVRM